ncbi:40S ribosomal protein S17, partial [Sigmodon hispidus]
QETPQQDSRLCHTADEEDLEWACGGISIKLQEEDKEIIEVDPDTKEMLKLLDCSNISNLQVTQPTVGMNFKTPSAAI